MPWKRSQKALVHIYKAAADLSDQEYRELLYSVSGFRSAAAGALTQYHFDVFMPQLEAKLDYRIQEGFVSMPSKGKIRNLHYWRRRCPAKGEMSTRLRHKIFTLWDELRPRLPEAAQNIAYLTGMAQQACGYRVQNVFDLKAWQANCLVEALKDRLHYALKG